MILYNFGERSGILSTFVGLGKAVVGEKLTKYKSA